MEKSIGINKGKFYLHELKCPTCQNERFVKHKKKNIINNFLCRSCAIRKRGCKHLWRPITLIHCSNGIVVSAPSITKFCDDRKYLGRNAKYHFSQVLNGSRLHYKGWLLLENRHKIKGYKVTKQIVLELNNLR